MNEGREPLYIRVYEKYKGLIVSGKLAAGTKLPSIRMACAELGVSKTTVEAAYLQLEAEGYIKSKPQSGFYVTKIDYSDIGSKKPQLRLKKPRAGKLYMISYPPPLTLKALILTFGADMSEVH